MTRLERATLALRQAEIDLALAMERCEAAASEFRDAKLMEEPRFRQWPHDERSSAERMADSAANRDDTTYRAWRDAQVLP